tara:strand:- start:719 stop:1480 length:762 start_codon:yes stop_codon:yes gene_type:complete
MRIHSLSLSLTILLLPKISLAAGGLVHFNWTQLFPFVNYETIPVATAALAAFVLIVFSLIARAALPSSAEDIRPAGSFSVRGFSESLVDFIMYLNDMVVGEKHRKFIPLFGAIFVYVFFNNILGLFPGMTPATDNYNTTLAIGIFSFVMYNYFGLKEHGIAYLKHFLGPVVWLAWLMLPIELISHLVRPLSLGLRLMGNMQGDHTVLGIFLDLTPYLVPVVFYGIGTFVCFMQAFVFTLLSMVYVSMAIAHDH